MEKNFFTTIFNGLFSASAAPSSPMASPPSSPRSPRNKVNSSLMKSPLSSPRRLFNKAVGSPRSSKQTPSKMVPSSPETKSPINHDRFKTQLRPSPPASPVLDKWRQEKAPASTPTAINREPEFTIEAKVLGEGAFSKVKLGTNKLTGQKVAVKSFALPAGGVNAMNATQKESFGFLKKERDLLAKMPAHPNVIKLHHATEDAASLNLYLQYVEGGDCYGWLCERGRVAENVVKPIFKQMVEAVAHCHEVGKVCHRDIKLENYLLDRTQNRPVLIDFGFASPIPTDGIFRDFPGSPDYACPDILMGRPYDGVSADVYALGVMLYTMLYYRYPFHAENRSIMVRRVCEEQPRFDPNVRVSSQCIQLLDWMLRKRGSDRPSIRQILEHPFFAGC